MKNKTVLLGAFLIFMMIFLLVIGSLELEKAQKMKAKQKMQNEWKHITNFESYTDPEINR